MELDFTSDIIEKLLLKRALTDQKWLSILARSYDQRWFSNANVGKLANILVKFYEKHNSAIPVNVMQVLAAKQAEKYGFDLASINATLSETMSLDFSSLPDEIITSNIREFMRKKALSWALTDNIDIITSADNEKNSEKYQQIINGCLESLDRIQRISFDEQDIGMNYFSKDAMDEHWKYLQNPEAKIATGWPTVDRYTNGGFYKNGRMLALFMAQAGLGKSVFLSNLAVNFMKQNLSVVVISLEMSQDVYAQRFDAHITSKNINHLADSETDAVTARSKIEDFYKKYPNANLFIKEYPPRSINSREIDSYLERLKQSGHKFDVVIVDYLNLVLPNKQTDSMFKDGMAVSEELRALSYKYSVPFISACQSNSEGMNNDQIDMQNVSESRGIVHTVDALFAIYQTTDMRNKDGTLGFKIIKNRLGGMVGKNCKFKMDPNTLIVADVTGDNEINEIESSAGSHFKEVLMKLDDVD